ncbi:dipeptidyl aminopeptidase/acylaminoacyl peptidase [Bernardetia litoralis DSM 6794]|uniref:Dipeptidyl aminopeptidase/acylaminoacyl peptidase n=1 Tax=Bernardetia litoralis (strain ATCC 23117 / DSM 6794 / NBRC 15988 / NCIMB 1366 / Fx l1 / Sio-4) TaxID=880071 RepID=I4AH32_BERLS|nr:S9 family peptidase [Bernardetia litoralis]AFM03267.1 dipeptidyl aminopeptidase/acylaminoacyl peptidase [Bernardetia litoralis DSM 6794]
MLKKNYFLSLFLGIFAFSNIYFSSETIAQDDSKTKVSVTDIYSNRSLYSKNLQGVDWTNNGGFYTRMDGNAIVRYEIKTNKAVETIFDGNASDPKINIAEYSFSDKEDKILIQTNRQSIYRRSYMAEYYVVNMSDKSVKKLSEKGRSAYATFSPDGSKVAFFRKNNLFYVTLSDMKEVQITDDGLFNKIINGAGDWVYEEEFSLTKAFDWSPDGKNLAFVQFNESEVTEYNMQYWADKSQLYPIDYKFKYPKAGEDNSTLKVFVYNLDSKDKKEVDLGEDKDIYVPRLEFTHNSDILAIRRMNRLQNKIDLIHANVKTGETKVVYSDEDKDGYVDFEYTQDLIYLKDGKHFIVSSERTGYKHLYLYTMEGKQVRQITNGDWEVIELLGVQEENVKMPLLYYISTQDSPLERHLYMVDLKGKKTRKMTDRHGTNSVDMSKDFSFYILTHESTEMPVNYRLYQTKGNLLLSKIQDNDRLIKTFKENELPQKELSSFKNRNGETLNYQIFKPLDFDENKKYPVLMHVYGGPGSQLVTDAWAGGTNDLWHGMLTQKGYIVVTVDNRGTQGRGEAFKKATYKNLGKLEVEDQIDGAKFLATLSFVDKERIGIWGWSYGGYMSSLLMMLGADYFKAGIAVAPVTSWRYYDTIYTERFLQRPQDNAAGYDDFSPITHAGKLEGKFLLVHGTGDDNVHIQNSIQLQNALVDANKPFEMFYYADKNHGIYGGMTRIHLYNMMTKFVEDNL